MKRQVKSTKQTKRTFFLFIIGVVVALGIFFFLQNPKVFDIFQANVLSIQDKDVLIAHDRDVGYKTQDGVLDVYVSDSSSNANVMAGLTELEVEVLFSEHGMQLYLGDIEYQGDFEVIVEEAGRYVFKFSNLGNIDFAESLFVLPFVGEMNQLLVGQVRGSNDNLRVGNLNTEDKHRN